jgi:glycosyltransferase involved in cell wall biosynthesis
VNSATGDGSRLERDRTAAAVTIVICTRDRAAMLADALNALLSAVPAGADVLVVDSGSTSAATRDAAAKAGVRYVRSDVPGLSIARNAGLSATDREFVVFTDDDCALTPGFLDPLIAVFDSPEVAAATGALRDIASVASPDASPVEILRRTTQGLDAGHGALMAFRRSALVAAGSFDPLLGAGRHFGGAEDMDVLCRLLHAGHTVARVPASVVTHVYTRTDDDYITLNENYGRGIGAMCAKWLRGDRRAGLSVTALVARRGVVRYLRRVRTTRARRGQQAYLRAVVRGLREAWRLPVRGLLFVDTAPPAPVTIPPLAVDSSTERLPA